MFKLKQFKKAFVKYEKVFILYLKIKSFENIFIVLLLNSLIDSGTNKGLSCKMLKSRKLLRISTFKIWGASLKFNNLNDKTDNL